jgi:GMP synthase (glutamine-hydrolysing)
VVRSAIGGSFSPATWHQDAIAELPAGAVSLATGARYPHQAFRLGERAWGVQYHPEVTTEDWADWMAGGHGAVRTTGLDPAAVMAATAAAEPSLASIAAAHAAAVTAVMVADRALQNGGSSSGGSSSGGSSTDSGSVA